MFVRCRKPLPHEETEEHASCVDIKGTEITIQKNSYLTKSFVFDGIFGEQATQKEVFDAVALDAIKVSYTFRFVDHLGRMYFVGTIAQYLFTGRLVRVR